MKEEGWYIFGVVSDVQPGMGDLGHTLSHWARFAMGITGITGKILHESVT